MLMITSISYDNYLQLTSPNKNIIYFINDKKNLFFKGKNRYNNISAFLSKDDIPKPGDRGFIMNRIYYIPLTGEAIKYISNNKIIQIQKGYNDINDGEIIYPNIELVKKICYDIVRNNTSSDSSGTNNTTCQCAQLKLDMQSIKTKIAELENKVNNINTSGDSSSTNCDCEDIKKDIETINESITKLEDKFNNNVISPVTEYRIEVTSIDDGITFTLPEVVENKEINVYAYGARLMKDKDYSITSNKITLITKPLKTGQYLDIVVKGGA